MSNNYFYRYIIIIYIFILIEGSLRKWVFYSNSIYVIIFLDLLFLILFLQSIKQKIFNINSSFEKKFILWFFIISLWLVIQIMLSRQNVVNIVATYRNWVLYFGLSIIIFKVMDREKINNFIKIILTSSIPITLLSIVQHYYPSDHIINKQLSGDIYTIAFGIVRTTSTFTFSYGFQQYLFFLTPFVLWLIVENNKFINYKFKFFILILFATSTLLSGSRSIIFFVAYMFIPLLYILFKERGYFKFINILISIFLFYYIYINFFQQSYFALIHRFENATDDEIIRLAKIIFGSLGTWEKFNYFGYGLSFGSNITAKILGYNNLVSGENETDRMIIQAGLLGIMIIISKYILSFFFLKDSIYKFINNNNKIYIIFTFYFILQILTSQIFNQINANFFTIISLGLILRFKDLSIKKNEKNKKISFNINKF